MVFMGSKMPWEKGENHHPQEQTTSDGNNETSSKAKRRIIIYITVTLVLALLYYYLKFTTWESSGYLHTVMETIASILAFQVGILSLSGYYAQRNVVLLFLGIGFIGAGFIDAFHTIITAPPIVEKLPSSDYSFITWSWITSRFFLSIFMFLSWFMWYKTVNTKKTINEVKVYVLSLFLIGIAFLTIFFAPLPSPFSKIWGLARPFEAIPALLFLVTLVGYLYKGTWKYNVLEHWIVLSLIVSFLGQAMFMSHSGLLYDNLFDSAHLLKLTSYICVLMGLLISVNDLFKDTEKLTQNLETAKNNLDVYSKQLEHLVAERTSDLKGKNDELENTVQQLRTAQKRLVIQEKLASLGALTAGIAHEIKNPLNFINNFSTLAEQRLESLQNLVEKNLSTFSSDDKKHLTEDFDELKDILVTIGEQGKRTDNIVQRMLEHSRRRSDTPTATEIHSLIDEYLDLAFHSMRVQNPNFNVKIEKDYDHSVSKINLIAGDISRALLNFFNNAFYSVTQKKKALGDSYTPIVAIKTRQIGEQFEIFIKDNGIGMSEEIKAQLFSPFFTTKPVGDGTGLGLSLSYEIIVHEHKGMITFDSKEGEFAEFVIYLPHKIS